MATLIDLSDWLGDLMAKIQPRQSDLQLAAENQKHRIETRTAQGVGVDLQPFTGYAPGTSKQAPVDLRKTGAMLESMTVEANDQEARIYFGDSDQEAKAMAHNQGTKYLPQRYFFGASLQDHEEIVSDIRAGLFKRVNNG